MLCDKTWQYINVVDTGDKWYVFEYNLTTP